MDSDCNDRVQVQVFDVHRPKNHNKREKFHALVVNGRRVGKTLLIDNCKRNGE